MIIISNREALESLSEMEVLPPYFEVWSLRETCWKSWLAALAWRGGWMLASADTCLRSLISKMTPLSRFLRWVLLPAVVRCTQPSQS